MRPSSKISLNYRTNPFNDETFFIVGTYLNITTIYREIVLLILLVTVCRQRIICKFVTTTKNVIKSFKINKMGWCVVNRAYNYFIFTFSLLSFVCENIESRSCNEIITNTFFLFFSLFSGPKLISICNSNTSSS